MGAIPFDILVNCLERSKDEEGGDVSIEVKEWKGNEDK